MQDEERTRPLMRAHQGEGGSRMAAVQSRDLCGLLTLLARGFPLKLWRIDASHVAAVPL